MDAYLRVVQDLAREFEFFELTKVPRGDNACADALAALGSRLRDQVKRTIPIHHIDEPSIGISAEAATIVAPINDTEMPQSDQQPVDWRSEFINYLLNGVLPSEKWEARRLKRRSAHYAVMNDELYRYLSLIHI